ncbi:hypothetical protein V499_02929 [Pseudogymnoascus sp. VKM F-103]|nr:hypothetical protein V499_02929 [Pseudogymnoascus sp. VKM F-103]
MGRKTLSKEGQAALAQSRGCFEEKTSKEQNHVDVGELFQNFLAAKGIQIDYARITKSKIDKNISRNVANYIKGSLKAKIGLSTKKRDKYLVTNKDLTISFALIFFANTGARGGACVESSCYRGTNEAIVYKDCRVHLLRCANGSFTLKLEVVQRYLKGRRHDENDKDTVKIHAICTRVANKIKGTKTGSSMLYRSARASNREKWFSSSFDEEAQRQLEQEDDETLPKLRGTFPLTHHLMLERDRIANTLFVAKGLQSKAGQAVLQDVYSLCSNDNQVAYRPNEWPVNGACPSNNYPKVIADLAPTPASFGTKSSHLQSTAMHVANGATAHFQDAHCIEEPHSNCVTMKRKSEDDEENVQDPKGEALSCMSKKAKGEHERVEEEYARSTTS